MNTESSKNKKNAPKTKRVKKILVVDDNRDIVTALITLLSLSGYTVVGAHNGPDALAAARAHKPDAILLDIGLPGMDGYEVAKALRAEIKPETTIIALSGYGQSDDKSKAKKAGFDHHLTKPSSLAEIEELLG